MTDYASRIRAVCDHLETVPGDKYDFYFGHINYDGCGCVVAHGRVAGIIAEGSGRNSDYYEGYEWMGFSGINGNNDIVYVLRSDAFGDGCGAGEKFKQAAIKNLRAYADTLDPPTEVINYIPQDVLSIFQERVVA